MPWEERQCLWCSLWYGGGQGPWHLEQSLGFVLQVDEVTDLLASFTSLSLQMQNMEKR